MPHAQPNAPSRHLRASSQRTLLRTAPAGTGGAARRPLLLLQQQPRSMARRGCPPRGPRTGWHWPPHPAAARLPEQPLLLLLLLQLMPALPLLLAKAARTPLAPPAGPERAGAARAGAAPCWRRCTSPRGAAAGAAAARRSGPGSAAPCGWVGRHPGPRRHRRAPPPPAAHHSGCADAGWPQRPQSPPAGWWAGPAPDRPAVGGRGTCAGGGGVWVCACTGGERVAGPAAAGGQVVVRVGMPWVRGWVGEKGGGHQHLRRTERPSCLGRGREEALCAHSALQKRVQGLGLTGPTGPCAVVLICAAPAPPPSVLFPNCPLQYALAFFAARLSSLCQSYHPPPTCMVVARTCFSSSVSGSHSEAAIDCASWMAANSSCKEGARARGWGAAGQEGTGRAAASRRGLRARHAQQGAGRAAEGARAARSRRAFALPPPRARAFYINSHSHSHHHLDR